MADTVKLVLEFQDAEGTSRKWSFSNADMDAEASTVKALAQGMITNGSIYAHPPVKIVNAQFVITTAEDINITD